MDDAAADPLVMPLDLLREITNDFSAERKLGSGTFGKVYKGVYQDGKTIAVKMLYDMPGLDDVQFQNEFKHLRRLQHQNIVRLVGYCLNIQEVQVMYGGNLVIAEKTHRALCLEYMCNGSLAKHLSDECDRYDWQKSYRIIKGICQGLNYLHNELNPSIFHLDLKPDNVLLDENMVPRIADFGISRLLTDGHTVATKTSLGTFGYLPPEYIKSGLISPKFDIFSLGVIILKILAGREGYSNSSEMSSQEFINLVHENLSSRLREGPNLRKAHCEQIKICVEIGISCREDDRHKRPPIKEIVDRLNETETKCTDASRKDRLLIDQDDLEPFGDVGSLDDNVESFLSNDEGDARDIFAAIKSFTFSEVNCWRTSNSKIVCCNFSSDGKILASAGHEKKAVLWNMDTFRTQYLREEHGLSITDVRFRPNSTQLATSSFDRTVKLWNIADPAFSQHTYAGHNYQVTSLDFHPKTTNLLCSCDGSGEIRYWNVTQHTCIRVVKGGTAQIRFQPSPGRFLAAASENVISIFDVETHTKKYTLQGHNTDVQSVCWDNTGEYLASVSQDLVKVWLVSSGECIHQVSIHEASSNGNKFHSCVFHPSYANLLVIGGYQSLVLWNMVKNQSLLLPAHDGLIASLAQSPVTGMVASASHDNSVKLWK